MIRFLLTGFLFILTWSIGAQPHCVDKAFHREVKNNLSGTVPLLDVETLFENYADFRVLDAREVEEFEISHLPGATYAGYDHFNIEDLADLDREMPIVVYCSIGYRSERIGEILQDAGFEKVFNLYGSIFEWANRGYRLDDPSGQRTKKLHTYNKAWSRWVSDVGIEKVW